MSINLLTKEEKTGGEIITFANHMKGGSKTFSAIHLGQALSKKGMKVLLIDMDPEADLTSYLGCPKKKNVLDLCKLYGENRKWADPEFALEGIYNCENGLDLITANKWLLKGSEEFARIEERASALKEYLSFLKLYYDFILIDSTKVEGGEVEYLGIEIIPMMIADSVLIPVPVRKIAKSNFENIEPIKGFLECCEEIEKFFDVSVKIKGIFFTIAKPSVVFKNAYEKYIREKYSEQIKVFDIELPYVHGIDVLMKERKTLFESRPNGYEVNKYIIPATEQIFF